MVILQLAIMRSYGKNWTWKKTATYSQRQSRLATEWDVRVDVSERLTVEDIVNNVKNHTDELLYVLVSGVERPDENLVDGAAIQPHVGEPYVVRGNQYGSREHHVHLCIVLLAPLERRGVLELVRGQRKIGDEYCTPRNPKFAYAGWVLHHAKLSWKLEGEPDIRYECGTLPMDPMTTDWALKIRSMMKKYECADRVKNRFTHYLDIITRGNIEAKIAELQAQLLNQ